MPTLLGNLRFSRKRCWRFKSSGILRRLDWQIFTEVTKNHTSSPAVHQAWHNSLLGMQSISHLAWNVRIRRQMSQMFPCPQAFTQQLAHPQFLYALCTTCSWHLPSISNCICECSTLPALCTFLQSARHPTRAFCYTPLTKYIIFFLYSCSGVCFRWPLPVPGCW